MTSAPLVLLAAEGEAAVPYWTWLGLFVLAPVAIALDLYVVPRRDRETPLWVAVLWSIVWLAAAFGFAGLVAVQAGSAYAATFMTGFTIEKALTIDQVVVFALVVREYRPHHSATQRIVFLALWLGLLMRLPFIAIGALLAESDLRAVQVGEVALLALAGLVLLRSRTHEPDPEHNPALERLHVAERIDMDCDEPALVVSRNDRRILTRAGATLVALLTIDLFFAATVPLVFAYSKPALLVFASNVFAIMGFRSMYLVVERLRVDLSALKVGLACVFFLLSFQVVFSRTSVAPWTVPMVAIAVVAIPLVGAARRYGVPIDADDEL